MLQTVTVTKDQQNPISITLSEDQAKSLKNKEKLKVSIKQKQSKKTSKDFFFEVGIDPKVEAKQKEKLLELDKVKKQIEDSINGDAWLPEKPEGEKPVQNTNKELQLQELNKKYQMAKEAIESATTLDDVETQFDKYTKVGDKDKYPDSLRNQYTQGDKDKEIEKAKKSLGDLSDKVNGKIEEDKWLSAEVKKKQQQELEARKQKVNDSLKGSDSLKSLRETVEKASSKNQKKPESFEDVYVPGNEETEKTKVRDILQKTYQKTEQNIETDPWLSPEQKKAQKENAKTRLDAGLKAVETTESLDKLKEVESDFLDKEKNPDSIPNQHKAGTPEVARKTFLDNFEKEAKKEIESIKNDVTEAKNADELDKAYGEGVTDIKNQYKSGDPIEARRGLHNKSIDKVAQATKDAITADTTLTEAEKETQRGNVDKEATKAKEELAKAKDADALDKAYGDGVTSIKNQHKSGKGLDVRKDEHKKALEAVAKRVTAEIEADPTLTPEVREQQKAEVQKELELATDKIAEAKDADEADKAYGDGVTAIENAHVIGKGIEARKDLAKKDLAEAVAKTKALIIEDKTLTDDQRKEQLSGVDTEYAKGIENIDAAKDAAGVDKAYSDGVRDILAQYKEGQNLDDRRNAAKEFLLKEADKVTKLINDDPTLTHDQKVDQINKVEQAKLDAIKSVDDAQTADAINDALGKGIENINNQYQHGDGVDVRKATAKGDLEKE
ncbi:TPA: DUF1542 domain-containing protein, partial [Streptococcus pyogenes]|nr:DUF1542 domain-containing protein [Streptococcus pyogenes]